MAISSATSFGLSVLAGRVVGASGLGVVFAGFTAYVMLLTVFRALVTTPLMASSSALTQDERTLATRMALTMTLAGGLAAAGILALVGNLSGGPIGHGLLAFSPWLLFAFTHELVRSSLVRDGRARRAACTDVAWLATMAILAPVAAQAEAVWAIVAAWGLGGVVAASIGLASIRFTPAPLSTSRTWFMRVAFPFGRWLVLQEGSFVVGFYGLYVLLISILGVSDLGGLRAAESVFSLFSLLAPALMLAGLPAVSRAYALSHDDARRLAVGISTACFLLTLPYSGLMLIEGPRILTAVFGEAFEQYGDLVVPMTLGQLALAAGVGFGILLRAEQRGKANLAIGTVGLITSVLASVSLAAYAGIEGAVWGLSLGAVVGAVLVILVGARSPAGQISS